MLMAGSKLHSTGLLVHSFSLASIHVPQLQQPAPNYLTSGCVLDFSFLFLTPLAWGSVTTCVLVPYMPQPLDLTASDLLISSWILFAPYPCVVTLLTAHILVIT